MKAIKLIALITLLSTIQAYAQFQRINRFPLATFHQKNSNITGISFGAYTTLTKGNEKFRNVQTNGIRLEAIGGGIVSPLLPFSPISTTEKQFLATMRSPASETVNGLNFSPAGTICDCVVNGISAGLVGQINREVSGISLSMIDNMAEQHNGVQLALFNESYVMNGFQIGLGNSSGKAKGIQLGLFNHADNLKGVQLGLWNSNGKRKLPIINWNFKD
jgi:hypothetical protein